jgi:hypothetical protein
MKTKKVTVSFEYTNFDVLESMINRLREEVMQGKEYFEDMVMDANGAKRYLQFMQEYKTKRNYVVNTEKTVVTIKSNI